MPGCVQDLLTSHEREEIRRLPKEVFELRRANDSEVRVAVLRAGARPGRAEVGMFSALTALGVDIEPACPTLDVSASAYYQRERVTREPD